MFCLKACLGLFFGLMLSGSVGFTVSHGWAGEQAIDLNSPDAIRQTLAQHTGKRIKLMLISGQDLDGKVAQVGTQTVVISELVGMEFFSATVRVDQVAAVIMRVRNK